MKVKANEIFLPIQDKSMMVYHAQPTEQSKNMAVIVFMEAFGVNGHIRDVCHRLALEGYEVFAPDLFYRWGDQLQFDYSDRESAVSHIKKMTEQDLLQDIGHLIHHLEGEKKIKHISTLGFCIGGYISFLTAINFPLVSAISYYGAGMMHERAGFQLGPLKKSFHLLKAPVLLFFGDLDASIPLSEVKEIDQELNRLKLPYQIHIFKDANHGFFCGQRGSYQVEAAHQSWDFTLDWLNDHYSMAERSSSVSSGESGSGDGSPLT